MTLRLNEQLLSEGHLPLAHDRLGPWIQGAIFSQPLELTHPQALYDGRNYEVYHDGSVFPRGGCSKLVSSAYTSSPTALAIGQHRFTSASAAKFYITATGKFLEESGGSWLDRTNGVSISTNSEHFCSYADAFGTAYFAGESTTPIKWAASGNIAAAGISSRFTWAKKVIFWDNRLWYFNTNTSSGELWWSDQDNLEVIGANSFFDLNIEITSAIPHRNRLYVHTKDRVFILAPTGNALVPYTRDPLEDFGTCAMRSLVKVPGGLQLFIREDGFYEWDGAAPARKISYGLDGNRLWDLVNKSKIPLCHAVVDTIKGNVWFWIPGNATDTTMTMVMVYSYTGKYWHTPWTGIARSASAIIDRVVYAGGYADGLVYAHDDGSLNDNSTNIDAWFETSGFSPEGEWVETEWLFSRLYFKQQNTSFSVIVQQQSPDGNGESEAISVDAEGDAIEDSFAIGVSAIAGSGSLARKDMDLSGFTPFGQFRVSKNSGDETHTLKFIDRFHTAHGIVRKPD